MTAVESVSTTTADSDTATDREPSESPGGAAEAVSWGPPELDWLQSFGIGGVAGSIVATIVAAVMWAPELVSSEWLSVDAVVLLVVFLLVGGPFSLLYWKLAYDEATEEERRSFREQFPQELPDWSSINPVWVGCGAVVFGVLGWEFAQFGSTFYMLPMTAVWLASVSSQWDVTWTVDPQAGVIETERPAHTNRRSLQWAVGVRRFDLFGRSLFVFSNRGKRWYEGKHVLSVPADLAPEVDPLLRRIVDKNDSPERIRRDERVITAGVGASMLAVGPFLYLLSGETALLLIAAGPSALIAHGLLLHATRG